MSGHVVRHIQVVVYVEPVDDYAAGVTATYKGLVVHNASPKDSIAVLYSGTAESKT